MVVTITVISSRDDFIRVEVAYITTIVIHHHGIIAGYVDKGEVAATVASNKAIAIIVAAAVAITADIMAVATAITNLYTFGSNGTSLIDNMNYSVINAIAKDMGYYLDFVVDMVISEVGNVLLLTIILNSNSIDSTDSFTSYTIVDMVATWVEVAT